MVSVWTLLSKTSRPALVPPAPPACTPNSVIGGGCRAQVRGCGSGSFSFVPKAPCSAEQRALTVERDQLTIAAVR